MAQNEPPAVNLSNEKTKKILTYLRILKVRRVGRPPPTSDSLIPTQIRHCTDLIGIVLLVAFLLLLLALIFYCVQFGDIHRVKNGVDSCGNVCGRPIPKGSPISDRNSPMFGRTNELGPLCALNNTDKKFLLYQKSDSIVTNVDHIIKTCVSVCHNEFESYGHKCLPIVGIDVANTIFHITGHENFFKEMAEDLCITWLFILGFAGITTVISLIGILTVRYFARLTIWVILSGLLLNALGAAIYSWLRWYDLHQEEHPSNAHKKMYNTYLIGGLSSTATSLNIALLILSLRNKIKLIGELYREAGRAVTDMPLLFLIPVITLLILSVVSALWLYFSIWVESSGHLTLDSESSLYYYKKDVVMHVTRWFNILIIMWLLAFIVSCQDLVVACSISHWYFTRNKKELKRPIRRSAFYLFRYHLGSVALFTLCTSTFRFLRMAMKKFEFALVNPKNQYIRPLFSCCECCIAFFERYLALMSRNAYIEMSLQGKSFIPSGKEAFLMIVENRWTMQAISTTGDYVLFFLKILAVFPSVVLAAYFYQDIRGLNHLWILLMLTMFISFCISHCFISVIEMVIDSIFICYCHDLKWNDGVERPYFMTTNLLAFVKHTVEVAEEKGMLDLEYEEP